MKRKHKPLRRSSTNRLVTGVLGGFSNHFGWNPNVLRVLFSLFCLFTFPIGIIIYTVLWIIMPLEKSYDPKNVTSTNLRRLKGAGGIVFKTSSFIWLALFIAGALFLWFRKEDAAGVTNTMGYRLTNLLIEWIPLFLVILFVHLAWYHYLLKK